MTAFSWRARRAAPVGVAASVVVGSLMFSTILTAYGIGREKMNLGGEFFNGIHLRFSRRNAFRATWACCLTEAIPPADVPARRQSASTPRC
jgi:hypothetical protein